MKTLFDGSEETPGLTGLGIIPGMVDSFDASKVELQLDTVTVAVRVQTETIVLLETSLARDRRQIS